MIRDLWKANLKSWALGMASLTQGIFIILKPDWIEENGIGDDDLKCER